MGVGGSDLNLLIALHALLEEANVTRAGDRLGMSQPAMSTALSRLRRMYSDELLVRVGREYERTPLARALLPQLQRTLPLVESALHLGEEFDAATSERTFTIAASDYMLAMLLPGIRRRITEADSPVHLDAVPIPVGILEQDRGLLDLDFLIGPRGYQFQGDSVVILRDEFVCIVDPHNSRLENGGLALRDVRELTLVRAMFDPGQMTPVDRRLAELEVSPSVAITAGGWLPIPFIIAGSDALAIVPRRLADRVSEVVDIAIADSPFGRIELVEALWWHPSRTADPGHRWLRSVVTQAAAEVSSPSALSETVPLPRELTGTDGMRQGQGMPTRRQDHGA